MLTILELGDISIDVIRKDIKNLHLSVHPPSGRIRIAAPERMTSDAIRAFAIAHIGWIRKNQHKILCQAREPIREYVERESHFLWGVRVLLQVVEGAPATRVEAGHRRLVLFLKAGTRWEERHALVEGWYRDELRRAAAPLVSKLAAKLEVQAPRIIVQRMRTKWGSCNPEKGNIRLNTELAKKPLECLEYVVLHELSHLRERTHTPEFYAILDRFMPQWRAIRRLMNDLPLGG